MPYPVPEEPGHELEGRSKSGKSRPQVAAERQIKDHGARRGRKVKNDRAPKGGRAATTQTAVRVNAAGEAPSGQPASRRRYA